MDLVRMPSRVTEVLTALGKPILSLAQAPRDLLLSPSSSVSLQSLACALCIAALFLVIQRRQSGRPLRVRVLARALLPRRLIRSASAQADIGFFLFNALLASAMFGWAIVSSHHISVTVHDLLVRLLGPGRPAPLTPWIASSLLTIGLFLAYELGYWVDHRLSHAIPFLWAFHRVHHTAEQLSPLTNFRVHPVDSIVYLNILALFSGLTHGALTYWLGSGLSQFSIANNNVILFVFMFLLIHLQHSHVWIPARGFWGRIIQSPAHHQLHHSTNSAHFNRNFGGCLAVWDWLFGTLLIPEKHRERLAFGVESEGENPHSVVGAVIVPTARALTGLAAPLVHTRRTASRGV